MSLHLDRLIGSAIAARHNPQNDAPNGFQALAINALSANGFKHAFKDGKGGEINIKPADIAYEAMVCVKDNGLLFMQAGMGTALSLVRGMTASLGGFFAHELAASPDTFLPNENKGLSARHIG